MNYFNFLLFSIHGAMENDFGFSDYEISTHGNLGSVERTKTFKNGRKVKFSAKKSPYECILEMVF